MEFKDFDPNGTGVDNGNYFGLPFTPEESDLVLLSVPWDVTASYGEGAAYGPDAIIGASTQLDLYDRLNPGGWRRGIGTIPIDYSIQESSALMREEAKKVMRNLESGKALLGDALNNRRINMVNERSAQLNDKVYDESLRWLEQDKVVGLVGGDHSTPFGLICALAEKWGHLSILHIDAHADLRPAYEGFVYSHASIMYNVMTNVAAVERLVQVGVRDQCDAEAEFAGTHDRISQIDDYTLACNEFRGMTWHEQCDRIIAKLGRQVYVSFDIDGLAPENAPHTGTPVPGGLTFNKAVYLLDRLVESGRSIRGFDLVEVSPAAGNEWDANVGARMLYKLCNLALKNTPQEENR